jgi:hypothetical protein
MRSLDIPSRNFLSPVVTREGGAPKRNYKAAAYPYWMIALGLSAGAKLRARFSY